MMWQWRFKKKNNLHFLFQHRGPGLKKEHEKLKVLPRLSSFQQLQEQSVAFVLSLYIFYLELKEKHRPCRQSSTQQQGTKVHLL